MQLGSGCFMSGSKKFQASCNLKKSTFKSKGLKTKTYMKSDVDSVIGRELVFSTWYGAARGFRSWVFLRRSH